MADDSYEVPMTSSNISLGRMAIRLLLPLVAAGALLLGAAPGEALANVASVSVSTSANPTQGVPVSITVSGSTQLQRNLYVYVDAGVGASCASDPGSEAPGDTALAAGTSVGPGNFNGSYSYTPPAANAGYLICAYVDDATYDTPDVAGSSAFTSAIPESNVEVATSAESDFGASIPITVSTDAPVAESLEVQVCLSDGTCSSLTPTAGQLLNAGPGSATFSYTPLSFGPFQIEASTTYGSGSDQEPTGSASVSVTTPNATLQAPADQAIGPQLNPTFTWQGGRNEVFAVVLGSVRASGRVAEIEQLQAHGVGDLTSVSRNQQSGLVPARNLYSLGGIATFKSSSIGTGSARLDQPLPPGEYSWRVISAGPGYNRMLWTALRRKAAYLPG
jgi:hypothetical protein